MSLTATIERAIRGAFASHDETERYAIERVKVDRYERDWNEADHPRGQPENAGEFSSAGASSTEKPQGERPAKGKGAIDEIESRAKSIQFSDDRVDGEPVDRDDTDAIMSRMSAEQIDDMNDQLNEWRDDRVDEAVRDADLDVDYSDLDSDNNFDALGISNKCDELIDEEDIDDDEKTRLKEKNDEWYKDTSESGDDAIHELRNIMRDNGAPDDLLRALANYQDDSSEAVDAAKEAADDKARDTLRNNLSDEHDDSEDRSEYLKNFYRENESLFAGEPAEEGHWGRDEDGDRAFRFTVSDSQFEITADERQVANGVKALNVSFADESGSYSITGKLGAKGAVEVFRTVSASVLALVRHEEPNAMTFTAAEPSRQSLYDKLTKTVTAANPEYAAVAISSPGKPKTYVVAKKHLLPGYIDKIGTLGLADAKLETLVKYSREQHNGERRSSNNRADQAGTRRSVVHGRALAKRDRSGNDARGDSERYQQSTSTSLRSRIADAAALTDRHPTPEQAIAGNYAKGKVWLWGHEVSIENPKGSTHSGTSKDGKAWSVTMNSHYGYIRRTISKADGDAVDVFIGPHPESEAVFIVNQQTDGGHFDEHKAVIGCRSLKEAKALYLANYSAGWKGCRNIVAMTKPQFLRWLAKGDTSRAVKWSDSIERYAFDEQKHPRGHQGNAGQFASGSSGGSFESPALGTRRAFPMSLHSTDGKTANVSINGSEWHTKVPHESLEHIHADMTGDMSFLKKHGPSDHDSINAVINGKAKMIGKGDDSVVFEHGNDIVKASTVVPFQPANAFYKTPKESGDRATTAAETMGAMKKAGVTGIPKTSVHQVGDKVFTVTPKLRIPEKFTPEQLKEMRGHLQSAHAAGYAINDDIQMGVGDDGKLYHYDLGKAEHYADEGDRNHYQQGDEDRLRSAYRSSGVEYHMSLANARKGLESHKRIVESAVARGKKLDPNKPDRFMQSLIDSLYHHDQDEEAWDAANEWWPKLAKKSQGITAETPDKFSRSASVEKYELAPRKAPTRRQPNAPTQSPKQPSVAPRAKRAPTARQPGDGSSGWQRVGGAPVFVDGSGKITKGCPGLKHEHVSDLIDEGDDSRDRRESKMAHAQAAGLKGHQVSGAQLRKFSTPKAQKQHQAAKSAAKSTGVPTHEVLKAMPDAHAMQTGDAKDTELARQRARQITGLDARKISRIENAYRDHSTVPNFDVHANTFANEHPHLFDPDDADTPQAVWDFIKAGKQSIPALHDPKIATAAADRLYETIMARLKSPAPASDVSDDGHSSEDDGSFDKFSRRVCDRIVEHYKAQHKSLTGQKSLWGSEDEQKHPRANDGKFTSGGSGGGSSSTAEAAEAAEKPKAHQPKHSTIRKTINDDLRPLLGDKLASQLSNEAGWYGANQHRVALLLKDVSDEDVLDMRAGFNINPDVAPNKARTAIGVEIASMIADRIGIDSPAAQKVRDDLKSWSTSATMESYRLRALKNVRDVNEWAQANKKNPPALHERTSNQHAALTALQRIDAFKNDQKAMEPIVKAYNEWAATWQNHAMDYSEKRRIAESFEVLTRKPKVRALVNRHAPEWDQPIAKGKTADVEAAARSLASKIAGLEQANERGWWTASQFAKDISEHKAAVVDAMQRDLPLPMHVIAEFTYDDDVKLPDKYQGQLETHQMLGSHASYMKSDWHKFAKTELAHAMKEAAPHLEPLMAKIKSSPTLVTAMRLKAELSDAERQLEALQDQVPADNEQALSLATQAAEHVGIISRIQNHEAKGPKGREWVAQFLPQQTADVTVSGGEHMTPEGQANLTEGFAFLRQAIGKQWGDVKMKVAPLPESQNGRACAQNDAMMIRPSEPVSVIIHEAGHILEHSYGNALATLSKAFAMDAVEKSGDVVQRFSQYHDAREIGAKDGFREGYSGKFYDHASSEVLSMGLQHLYEDAVGFAVEAPEHFQFTLAALHGMLV